MQLTLLMWWFYCRATVHSRSCSVWARGVVGYVNTPMLVKCSGWRQTLELHGYKHFYTTISVQGRDGPFSCITAAKLSSIDFDRSDKAPTDSYRKRNRLEESTSSSPRTLLSEPCKISFWSLRYRDIPASTDQIMTQGPRQPRSEGNDKESLWSQHGRCYVNLWIDLLMLLKSIKPAADSTGCKIQTFFCDNLGVFGMCSLRSWDTAGIQAMQGNLRG